jgi:hypothetical protein
MRSKCATEAGRRSAETTKREPPARAHTGGVLVASRIAWPNECSQTPPDWAVDVENNLA